MRPISHGFYKYSELLDGSLTLLDVQRCNDMIDVFTYNNNLQYEK
jgi:hypothetical protein